MLKAWTGLSKIIEYGSWINCNISTREELKNPMAINPSNRFAIG